MIDILKLVMGAVATKDMVQILTHFCVYSDLLDPKGRIQGTNGIVYVDAPFDHDIVQCAVPAKRFLKAIEACTGKPSFGLTEGGKLSVKSNRFRAYLPILPCEDFPRATLDGTPQSVPPGFVPAIRRLKPFISEDASRPWSLGVLFRAGYAYASNNIILARTPIDWGKDDLVIPIDLVNQLLEIETDPDTCYIRDNYVSFAYGDTWIRSQLITTPWPDVNRAIQAPAEEEIPPDLVDAVLKVKAFCVNENFPVINLSDVVSTDQGDHGASFEGFDLPSAKFHGDQLMKVLEVATHVNFTSYPAPCAWRGPDLEGIMVGLRLA